MPQHGTVTHWHADKGYGFIRSPQSDQPVFFHIRDFRQRPADLQPGLTVEFELIHVGGKGPRAMALVPRGPANAAAPARRPSNRPDDCAPDHAPDRAAGRTPDRAPGRPPAWPMLLLITAYVTVTGWAVLTRRLLTLIAPALLVVNLLTFWIYWQDKHAARTDAWRTPEKTLHGLSLLGGWPGAWWAQQLLRHKSAKQSFRQTYFATVVLHWLALIGLLVVSGRISLFTSP